MQEQHLCQGSLRATRILKKDVRADLSMSWGVAFSISNGKPPASKQSKQHSRRVKWTINQQHIIDLKSQSCIQRITSPTVAFSMSTVLIRVTSGRGQRSCWSGVYLELLVGLRLDVDWDWSWSEVNLALRAPDLYLIRVRLRRNRALRS